VAYISPLGSQYRKAIYVENSKNDEETALQLLINHAIAFYTLSLVEKSNGPIYRQNGVLLHLISYTASK
jgi:hypothetical protein